jgi:uncharacterized protein (DUF1778 family)
MLRVDGGACPSTIERAGAGCKRQLLCAVVVPLECLMHAVPNVLAERYASRVVPELMALLIVRASNVRFEGVRERLEDLMARSAVDTNNRMQLRMTPAHKARIARAAALQQMDMTQFVTRTALREADAIIAQAETIQVSTRDFTRILELLEHPPSPNAALKAAIEALPDTL